MARHEDQHLPTTTRERARDLGKVGWVLFGLRMALLAVAIFIFIDGSYGFWTESHQDLIRSQARTLQAMSMARLPTTNDESDSLDNPLLPIQSPADGHVSDQIVAAQTAAAFFMAKSAKEESDGDWLAGASGAAVLLSVGALATLFGTEGVFAWFWPWVERRVTVRPPPTAESDNSHTEKN
jgi:hypothetical protein